MTLRRSVFRLALCTILGVASAAWGQTKDSQNVGGRRHQSTHQELSNVVEKYGPLIQISSERHTIPAKVLASIMVVESSGNPHVHGGLMQLTSGAKNYLRKLGLTCDFRRDQCAIEGAAMYLASFQSQAGDIRHLIVAYNRGPAGIQHVRLDRNRYLQRVEYVMNQFDELYSRPS